MIDFSTWNGLLSTLIGLALFTLLGVGVRLLVMVTIQQRRERLNRQINERLRTLIAAYKVLGGSFSGDLAVDPTHLRDLRRRALSSDALAPVSTGAAESESDVMYNAEDASDRPRRIRDAVEAALSDVILLGTEEQVRLAVTAANELAAGRAVHTGDLVISLRDFIRRALDLAPIPPSIVVPAQGPTRVAASGGRGKGDGSTGARQGGGARGGGGGAGGLAAGGGAGMGLGLGMGARAPGDEEPVSGSAPD